MSIQAIDVGSVHRLTSGQVVIDLQTAVKELLDNALDSGATSIQITFRDHGTESLEVIDNGSGIDQDDWPGIALKHHTSKLRDFSDLDSVETLGFRGEALSSLCALSAVHMVTSSILTAPVGTTLNFSSGGHCTPGSKVARPKGTTVQVAKLFESLPVRRKDFLKNKKREFGKALDLIQAYAIIKTGVRFEVKHVDSKGKTSTHLQTPIGASVRANYSSIFAPKAAAGMIDVVLELDIAPDHSASKWSNGAATTSTRIQVEGLISAPVAGQGRTTNNRSFYYVNGRPFSATKISKAVNEVYKNYNPNSFPSVVIDFIMPSDSYDVNVSPDKRTIFLHREGNLIAALKTALEELFAPTRSSFPMAKLAPSPTREAHEDQIKAAQEGLATHSGSSSRRSSSPPSNNAEQPPAIASSSRLARKGSSPRSPSPLPPTTDHLEAFTNERPTKRRRRSVEFEEQPEKPKHESEDEDELLADPASPDGGSMTGSSRSFTSASRSKTANPLNGRHRQTQIAFEVIERQKEEVSQTGLEKLRVLRAKEIERRNLQEHRAEDDEQDEPELDQDQYGKGKEFMSEDEVDDVLIVEDPGLPEDSGEVRGRNVTPPLPALMDELGNGSLEEDQEGHEMAVHDPPLSTLIAKPEIVGAGLELCDIVVAFNLVDITSRWTRATPSSAVETVDWPLDATAKDNDLTSAGLSLDSIQAEKALSRVVAKDDFLYMDIIGQFNHAFIIARRSATALTEGERDHDDLFIIDQHASDEKFNFEELQAKTVIQSQKLLQPRKLDLPSHDELIAIEHVDQLRLNGFEVLVDEEAPVGQRVKLVAQPVSGTTSLGVADLEELLEIIKAGAGGSSGPTPRPSKIRKMFASRACRKSVMFGRALTMGQMSTIVKNMNGMDQPWSCPHGRPTLRWLASLDRGRSSGSDGRGNIAQVIAAYH